MSGGVRWDESCGRPMTSCGMDLEVASGLGWFWPCPASVVERAMRLSFSILMYSKNAELCQRPSIWMAESSSPARAAVVAAPILKLCPT